MFRKMRRIKQQLSNEENVEILKMATSGVLAVAGDADYPYAVPISFVYNQGNIYFHSATNGHKIDAIKRNSKASFCVIHQDDILPEKFTTCYKSVVVFGTTRVLTEDEEIMRAINLLCDKYSPNIDARHRADEINSSYDRMSIIELQVEHMTGKEGIGLTKAKPHPDDI